MPSRAKQGMLPINAAYFCELKFQLENFRKHQEIIPSTYAKSLKYRRLDNYNRIHAKNGNEKTNSLRRGCFILVVVNIPKCHTIKIELLN